MDVNWFKRLADLVRGRATITLDDLQKGQDFVKEFNDWLRSVLPIGPDVVEEMTYSRAISYFAEQRPPNPRVSKGGMLLQTHPQGQLFVQVFLDSSNELVCSADGKPFGRRLVVRSLDAELTDTFGGKKLVIVE
jgi:hypothetical protein